MEQDAFYAPDSDLDLSFTSSGSATTNTSDRTLSARSSLARSSVCLSFNESRLSSASTTSTSIPNTNSRPHRQSDPLWSAVKTAANLSSDGSLQLRHLKLLRHVGSGNLGRVFLCRLRDSEHANFALKVVDRDSLSTKKLFQVQTEARILSALDHPFLPTLYAHLEVSHYTCLLIDFCPNGDLYSLLRKQPANRLPLKSVRFFAAEVLVALEYLHALGIVYRDLKPENILIREDGHIMLSDFDLCFNVDIVPKLEKRIHRKSDLLHSRWHNCFSLRRASDELVTEFAAEPTNAHSTSCVGTHEYLAPELLNGNGHRNGVDWWAFGVLIYELLYGTTPFKGSNKESTLTNIASAKDVKFPVYEGEEDEKGAAKARDLIERLLVKDPTRRLGCATGATDIKQHPFFDGIKWPLIRTYRPPELRGLLVKKNKTHVGGISSPHSRHFWWKKTIYSMIKNNWTRNKLNSNNNYYRNKHK